MQRRRVMGVGGGRGGRGYGFGSCCSVIWQIVDVTHTQFQTAGLSNSITLWTLPAGALVLYNRLKVSELFTGTGITNYYLSIGVSGAIQDLMTEYDAKNLVIGNEEYAEASAFQSFNYAATKDLLISARSVGANLDQSTAGAARIEILYVKKA